MEDNTNEEKKEGVNNEKEKEKENKEEVKEEKNENNENNNINNNENKDKEDINQIVDLERIIKDNEFPDVPTLILEEVECNLLNGQKIKITKVKIITLI